MIYIVRHGESIGNVKDIMGSDPDLTKKGEEQATNLSIKFANIHFNAVFSADLIRSRRTAEILTQGRKLPIITSKALRERDYGKYEGTSGNKYTNDLKDIFEKLNDMPYEQQKSYKRYDGFETDNEMMIRFINYLHGIIKANPGNTVLVVSSGSLMRILLIYLGFAKPDKLLFGAVDNMGYIKLEYYKNDFFVVETRGIKYLH